ncbi:methyltransferase domain-containing protein [Streptomyces zagrosensis]|uniref:Protein-L-isoaspartate O-methyltransferase n=1 Tax=Streptomyces zagrosensis TaxID=1042984 RepID=A0A7W9UWH8_9ACTN|nr:methyltransferase domain-containing protein [Streptomyces zagrosensis]MBB5933331.1 protein-L-isoaspartate(D-aspartate) O-methyltransferase [Streptomyces zagrosensis]
MLAEQQRLDTAMTAAGAWPESSPWIRQAVHDLPRHEFAPDRVWVWDGTAYRPIDRSADPTAWAQAVYAGPYDSTVTQLTGARATSSLSCTSVVADMLDSLQTDPGHRVLELGTGTGWNAGLLARHAARVDSVEVDADLAASAAQRLKAHGLDVAVHVGDGARGWPADAPYDRVISTYAVEAIPWTWIVQTRPGGRIVTPWGRLGHVALTVAADGRSAHGWMQGLAQFMPARHAPTNCTYPAIRGAGPPADERFFAHDLAVLHADWHLRFAVRARHPHIHLTTAADDDGAHAWLHDNAMSWANIVTTGGHTIAYQGGPHRLADQLEAAWHWWEAEGRPDLYDFGLTVTPDDQYAWCHDPDTGPRWPAPHT